MTKEQVNYRKARALSLKCCGTCAMYRLGGSCTLVEGKIRQGDICDEWDLFKRGPDGKK